MSAQPDRATISNKESGRVALLGEFAEGPSNWGLAPGRIAIGSSTRCSICRPELEPVHAILTVGKKNVLLQAVGAVRIGERRIREWLIDRSVIVRIGPLSFRIEPTSLGMPVAPTAERSGREDQHPPRWMEDTCLSRSETERSTAEILLQLQNEMDLLASAVATLKNPSTQELESPALDQRFATIARNAIDSVMPEWERRWLGEFQGEVARIQSQHAAISEKVLQAIEDRFHTLDQKIEDFRTSLRAQPTYPESVGGSLPPQNSLPPSPVETAEVPSEWDTARQDTFEVTAVVPQTNDFTDGHEPAVPDSEEPTFSVDDETISQRLQRMLSEANDSDTTIDVPSDEIAYDKVATSPRLEAATTDGDTDESIEEYMQRLLHRVRSGSDAPLGITPEMATPPKRTRRETSQGTAGVPLTSGRAVGETTARDAFMGPPAPPVVSSKRDLEAFREIANSNARRAISRSEMRRRSTDLLVTFIVVMISLTCGIALLFFNGFKLNAPFFAMIASIFVAFLWGFDAVHKIRIFVRDQEEQRKEKELSLERGEDLIR
jgi:hypothetical protein